MHLHTRNGGLSNSGMYYKKWKLKVLEDRMNLSFTVKLGVHHDSVKPLSLCCSKKQFLKSVKNLFTVGLFCIGGIYACEEN